MDLHRDEAPAASGDFWRGLDALVAAHRLVIDRPRGSAHPRYPEFVYPYDYGYLEGTTSTDGAGIDVWVGALPQRQVSGIVISVDLEKSDAELKLLLGCTLEEMQGIAAAHNSGLQSAILLPRPRGE